MQDLIGTRWWCTIANVASALLDVSLRSPTMGGDQVLEVVKSYFKYLLKFNLLLWSSHAFVFPTFTSELHLNAVGRDLKD